MAAVLCNRFAHSRAGARQSSICSYTNRGFRLHQIKLQGNGARGVWAATHESLLLFNRREMIRSIICLPNLDNLQLHCAWCLDCFPAVLRHALLPSEITTCCCLQPCNYRPTCALSKVFAAEVPLQQRPSNGSILKLHCHNAPADNSMTKQKK